MVAMARILCGWLFTFMGAMCANAEVARRSQLRIRAAAVAAETPGDVGLVDSMEDAVDQAVEGIAKAVDGFQDAAEDVAARAYVKIRDPVGTASGALDTAEGTAKRYIPGRGFVTQVLSDEYESEEEKIPEHPLVGNSPESLQNLENYRVQQVTPPPARINGQYCRGGACQYRKPVDPGQLPPPIPMLPGVPLMNSEFCRGLGCPPKQGYPVDGDEQSWVSQCQYFFNKVGAGMEGRKLRRNVADVSDSFVVACKWRVNGREADFCRDYADLFVAALAPRNRKPTVGDTEEVCVEAVNFIRRMKQAELDLGLLPGSQFPGAAAAASSSLLAERWKKGIATRLLSPGEKAVDECFQAGGTELSTSAVSLVGEVANSSKLANNEESRKPAYDQTAPCKDFGGSQPSQADMKYEVSPPNSPGPPIEIGGDLFGYCGAEMKEVMLNDRQTVPNTARFVKGWCTSKSIAPPPKGRPNWDSRSCAGMQSLLLFSLRDVLESPDVDVRTLAPQTVCRMMFIGSGIVHRVDAMIKKVQASIRGMPALGPFPPGKEDPEIARMIEASKKQAAKIADRVEAEKQAKKALREARKQMEDAQKSQSLASAAFIGVPSALEVSPRVGSLNRRVLRLRAYGR